MQKPDQASMAWDIIGHEWAVRQLQLSVERGELSHALLITGPESVGKRTLALTTAQAMLCQTENMLRPCKHCSACRRVASGNHPDLLFVDPEEAGKGVKIEQIRQLERFLMLTPNETHYKIAIVSAFELANNNAANALLKTLEEPPAYAHLLLLASDADTLLPTIVSRSQHIPLKPLSRETIARALVERWEQPAELAQQLARLSGGRLGWAIQSLNRPEQLQEMRAALELMLSLLHSDLLTRFGIAEDLAKDDVQLTRTLEYWRTGWRDVLLLQTGEPAELIYLEYQPALAALAQQCGQMATLATLNALGQAQAALQRNVNTRLLAEALLLELPELL